MNWLTDWDVSSLDDVLEQDVDYDTMIIEASDGVADLALQDYRDHPRRKSEVDSWYESASQAGDSATCRMIELLRDAAVDPQEIYNEAWELRARKETEPYYYHAGCGTGTDGAIEWSTRTHETYEAAEAEARKMAERTGTRGVVEYWDRAHGREPGNCEAVDGADWV